MLPTRADEEAACCAWYERACVWELDPQRRIVLKAMEPVRGQRGIFPLLVPELEFFTPDDRARAQGWLDWAQAKGHLSRIKGFTEDTRR